MSNKNKGFTLIELMVAIAIIGLVSSIISVSIKSTRIKARDAQRIMEFRAVQQALAFYFDKYRKYPNEAAVATNPWKDNFNSMAQQLVNEGFLSKVPVSPPGSTYQYYNYGSANPAGAIMVTSLEGGDPSLTGLPPSCRPFNNNWCSNATASRYYCLCNRY